MKEKITNRKSSVLGLIFVTAPVYFCVKNWDDFVHATNAEDFAIAIFPLLVFLALGIWMIAKGLLWKIEYDERSFKIKWDDDKEIEYVKIQSVEHYKTHAGRNSKDEFIIKYLGVHEFGYKEEIQELFIRNFPHNYKMKTFFTQMRESNPNIEFSFEKAGISGVEFRKFDYFLDDNDDDDSGIQL